MSYKGKDVTNVFHLRTPEDANNIAKLSNNKNAVIVGTSFVGEKHLSIGAGRAPLTHSWFHNKRGAANRCCLQGWRWLQL